MQDYPRTHASSVWFLNNRVYTRDDQQHNSTDRLRKPADACALSPQVVPTRRQRALWCRISAASDTSNDARFCICACHSDEGRGIRVCCRRRILSKSHRWINSQSSDGVGHKLQMNSCFSTGTVPQQNIWSPSHCNLLAICSIQPALPFPDATLISCFHSAKSMRPFPSTS